MISTAVSHREATELGAFAEIAGNVLELGALYGRSTLALAAGAKLVVSVDWHHGDADAGDVDSLRPYLENVRNVGNVIPVVGRFEQIVPLFARATFGLVFIDGAHDLYSVRRDLWLALSVLAPGGWVAMHDYAGGAFPDVARAVEEISVSRANLGARELVLVKQVDTLGFFKC